MPDFHGLPARTLGNAFLELDYLAEAGPRLVRLVALGSTERQNLLAETPGKGWPTPFGDYRLYGGHRLWHAPEGAPRSSVPDSAGLRVDEVAGGVRLSQPVEGPTGIAKSIEVRLCADRPALTLTHRLRNHNLWPVELAPWAITQLRLGGVAVVPQPQEPVDQAGLQPNRRLALWPYASVRDPRLELHDDVVLVRGAGRRPPLKIGLEDRLGWAAYALGDVVLVRRFWPQPERPHPDFGCNVEVYVDDAHLELEVLGPLGRLEPGQDVRHVECWEVLAGQGAPADAEAVRRTLEAVKPYLAPLGDDEPAEFASRA